MKLRFCARAFSTAILLSSMSPQVFAQTTLEYNAFGSTPSFRFSLPIDLGPRAPTGPMGPFSARGPLGLNDSQWHTLFGSSTSEEVTKSISDFSTFSSMQSRIFPKVPELIGKIQEEGVAGNTSLNIHDIQTKLNAGLEIKGGVLDVPIPKLLTNDEIANTARDFIAQKYRVGFDLEHSGFSNMITAKAYRVAMSNEQQQLEPYIAAQSNLNIELAKGALGYQTKTWSDVSEKLSPILQCSLLPANERLVSARLDAVWSQKINSLQDGLDNLQKLRSELDSDSKWTVGGPGGARELSIYLAEVVKTVTDLIENVSGFSEEKHVGRAKEIYDTIKSGRTASEIVKGDVEKAISNALLDVASDISPVARALTTIKDFGEDMAKITETPEKLASSRNEVKRQLAMMDKQMRKLRTKIDSIRSQRQEAHTLSNTYKSVQQMHNP